MNVVYEIIVRIHVQTDIFFSRNSGKIVVFKVSPGIS